MNGTLGIISANYVVPDYNELTGKRPPANLPFGGRYRLLDFALSNMVNSRISTVGLVTPYYYRSILDHVGAGKEWGLDRKQGGLFVLPGSVYGFKEERGSFLLRDIIRNKTFLEQGAGDNVLCCDASLVYNMDYRPMLSFHELSGNPVTLLFRRRDARQRRAGWYLKLEEDGRVTGMEQGESGEALFLNCFVINRDFFLRVLQDFHSLSYLDFFHVLPIMLSDIRVNSFEFTGYAGFTEGIGDYLRSSLDLLKPQVRHELFAPERQILTKIHDEPPALYASGAVVRNSVISAGSVIEGTVENSILFREVHVAKGAVVRNSVIMEQGEIGEGAALSWCVCDKQVRVSPGVTLNGTEKRPSILGKGKSL